MHAQCFCRLSARRASLSNAQLMLTGNNTASPGYPRLSPDVWRSLMPHEHHSANPHSEAVAPVTRTATAPPDTKWCNKIIEARDEAVTGQPRGSFRAQAPNASIGVAEMAAALALWVPHAIHTPFITEPPCAMFPMSIQPPSWATLLTVPDDSLAKPLSIHSPVAPDLTAAVASAPAPTTPRCSTSSDFTQTAAPAAAAPGLTYTAIKPAGPASEAVNPPATDASGAAGDTPASAAADATVGEYLPPALRSLVPASVADYWSGVTEATREGILHVTIYVSPKAWPQAEPTIAGMLGARGTGPAGQVRFALVPLGWDYAARASAAAAAVVVAQRTLSTGADGAMYDSGLAAQFGLDVALAAVATAGARGCGGVRQLDMCPAMVVRGGYTGSARAAGGEVSPAWSMRQDLDEHVRRNLQYTQQQLTLQPQPQKGNRQEQGGQVQQQEEVLLGRQQVQKQVQQQQQEEEERLRQQVAQRRRVEQLVAGLALWGAWAIGRQVQQQSVNCARVGGAGSLSLGGSYC